MVDETVFRQRRLCVVGNVCRDVKIAPIAPDERLFHDGETPTQFIVETIGGGGANSALSAAGLGAQVRFAGKLGDDALGTRLEAALRERGVRSFVRRDPRTPTGSSVALSFSNGCRHFISAQPNNDTFCFEDVDPAIFDDGGHLLRADVWFSQPLLNGGNAKLFEAARDRGLRTSLDLNWDPHWGSASEDVIRRRKEAVRRILPLVDLVHGNIRELNIFADESDIAATLKRLTAWGAGAVVLHMGVQGAGYYCGGELLVEPSVPVGQYLNTTGTGDLLSVCMMLLDGREDISVVERLRLANRIVADFIEGRRELLPPL
jgi:sugar/nucleoside kinase (ribokinase family)